MSAHKTAIVIGWNRCGTTMVSMILHCLGVPMLKPGQEEANSASHLNPKGHFEHSDFQHVFEKIRRGEDVSISDALNRNNKLFDLWGFKHPEVVIHFDKLVPFIRNGELRGPHLVFIVRNPVDTAFSLMEWHKRGHDKEGRDAQSKLELIKYWRQANRNNERQWKLYNENLDVPSILLTFSQVSNNHMDVARLLASFLEIEPNFNQVEMMLSTRLIPGYKSYERKF